MFTSRVTVVVGHFGSGKTEIAVNGALQLAERGVAVALVDLDVVKPYFRARSTRELMARRGVRVVAPEGENVHGDLPIIVPQVRALLADPEARVLMDVGGDPVGARALGSISDVVPVPETEHLLVLNFRRPYTETVEDAVDMVRAISSAARLPVTGLISNSHLLAETTPDVIREGFEMAQETSERIGVPVVAVGVAEDSLAELDGEQFPCPLFIMRRMIRPPFEASARLRRIGPLFVLN